MASGTGWRVCRRTIPSFAGSFVVARYPTRMSLKCNMILASTRYAQEAGMQLRDDTTPSSSAPAGEVAPSQFLNRELSWLDWNRRVLALAEDPSQRLLERVKYLAIVSANLDEFFQVRVAGLRAQVDAGVTAPASDGRTPREQLALKPTAWNTSCLNSLILERL